LEMNFWLWLVGNEFLMRIVGGVSLFSLAIVARMPWKYGQYFSLYYLGRKAFHSGNYRLAEQSARKLLWLANFYSEADWNYGNAVHHGNILLGLVYSRTDNIIAAKKYLIRAGETPGSPQLDSYGLNMVLASELIAKGEISAVLKYFKLCKKFWKLDRGRLNYWAKQARAGEMPSFGRQLNL